MTLTQLIAINALLDLAVVVAVFAIVRFAHRLRTDAGSRQPISLSDPVTAEELAEAALQGPRSTLRQLSRAAQAALTIGGDDAPMAGTHEMLLPSDNLAQPV